jgi:pyrroline-5-carboxylate reductase
MNKTIGFIGCGKMAQAMIGGMIDSELISPKQIIVSAFTEDTLFEVESRWGIRTTTNNIEVAEEADFLFLAVKPDIYGTTVDEIEMKRNKNGIIITIAAGIDFDFIDSSFGIGAKAILTMPNTPSLVGEGMTAMCANPNVTKDELEEAVSLIETFGKAEILPERLMNSVPAISGSSPAYVYLFIEALADGGVLQGIPRAQAYEMAAQAVLGAAKMVLETNFHPGELKDQVCTPGGATIEGVATLEKNNFRSAIIEAMNAVTLKAKSLKY